MLHVISQKMFRFFLFLQLIYPLQVYSNDVQSISIEKNGVDNFLFISVIKKENTELHLIWDTGSTFSLIDSKSVKKLYGYELPVSDRYTTSMSDHFDLSLSNVELSFVISKLDLLQKQGPSLDGIMGSDYFGSSTILFDFTNRNIKIFKNLEFDSNFSFSTIAGLPIITVNVNGKDCKALIDTGFNGSIGIYDRQISDSCPQIDFEGSGGTTLTTDLKKSKVLLVKTLKILGSSFHNIYTHSSGLNVDLDGTSIPVLIGTGFFKNGVLILDYKNKVGSWHETTTQEFPKEIFPIKLEFRSNVAYIAATAVGSQIPGVNIGDRVLTIDGLQVTNPAEYINIIDRKQNYELVSQGSAGIFTNIIRSLNSARR